MNQALFIALLIGGLTLVVLGVAWQQASQRLAARRKEQISKLSLRNRNLQTVQRLIPSQLLSTHLRHFIQGSQKANLEDILKLRPSQPSPYQAELKELQQAHTTTDAGVMEINSIEKANAARHALKSLTQEIKLAYQQKRLDQGQSQQLLAEVELKMVEIAGNFYRLLAEQSIQNGDFKNAYAASQKMLDAYQNNSHKTQFQTDIIKAKAMIKSVHGQWLGEKHNKERQSAQALADKVKDWDKERDSWKKSQLYDD